MKLKSELKVSKTEIEALVLEHLAKNNKHNLKFGAVRFNIREGTSDGMGGYGYEPSDLDSVTISVELELDDGREN